MYANDKYVRKPKGFAHYIATSPKPHSKPYPSHNPKQYPKPYNMSKSITYILIKFRRNSATIVLSQYSAIAI